MSVRYLDDFISIKKYTDPYRSLRGSGRFLDGHKSMTPENSGRETAVDSVISDVCPSSLSEMERSDEAKNPIKNNNKYNLYKEARKKRQKKTQGRLSIGSLPRRPRRAGFSLRSRGRGRRVNVVAPHGRHLHPRQFPVSPLMLQELQLKLGFPPDAVSGE
jgi:hypothetical protein